MLLIGQCKILTSAFSFLKNSSTWQNLLKCIHLQALLNVFPNFIHSLHATSIPSTSLVNPLATQKMVQFVSVQFISDIVVNSHSLICDSAHPLNSFFYLYNFFLPKISVYLQDQSCFLSNLIFFYFPCSSFLFYY